MGRTLSIEYPVSTSSNQIRRGKIREACSVFVGVYMKYACRVG